ncbi:MAG: rhamnulokinase [Bacilli bacterium]
MKYYLAIDLGASSGRHIIGYQRENGKIALVEVHRFRTKMDDSADGLVWNIPRLFKEIKKGIRKAFKRYPVIESLAIDTWGVDYVLINGEKEMPPFYAYRNQRCQRGADLVHQILPFAEIYQRTGIQYAPFNTLYQMYDDLMQGRLEKATDYLMLPSYFVYKLTGVKTHEYTQESTGMWLKATTGDYDWELLKQLGLPAKLFGEIKKPGFVVGELLPQVQKEVGGNCPVVLCASHDTGSAFEAVDVPADGIILSSGTWSLLGIKSPKPIINEVSFKANYANEGGVGYIRFLKNIMGMWIPNRIREEVGFTQKYIDQNVPFVEYKATFDVNDPSLLSPASMKEAVMALLQDYPPENNIELLNAVYHSLAQGYQKAIAELAAITKQKYRSIYVIGGGARNTYLNKLIGDYTKLKVVALPIEATALGNIKVQMKARP